MNLVIAALVGLTAAAIANLAHLPAWVSLVMILFWFFGRLQEVIQPQRRAS